MFSYAPNDAPSYAPSYAYHLGICLAPHLPPTLPGASKLHPWYMVAQHQCTINISPLPASAPAPGSDLPPWAIPVPAWPCLSARICIAHQSLELAVHMRSLGLLAVHEVGYVRISAWLSPFPFPSVLLYICICIHVHLTSFLHLPGQTLP